MMTPARRTATSSAAGGGEKRSNATHASTTDPDARLYRKGNNTGSCATRGTCSSRTATR